MKHFFVVVCVISAVLLSSCQPNNNNSSTTPEVKEVQDKWKEKDATYIGSDEFGEDLENISDELYKNAKDLGGYSGDKYTENVFQDAGDKYGISASKAESIWNKVEKAKLGLNY
ncbi:MAG: hypothetical protein QM344_05935 [Bacillota bacterium]|nr:hypothetical protein [Bacillota bacterium]